MVFNLVKLAFYSADIFKTFRVWVFKGGITQFKKKINKKIAVERESQ